MSKLLIKGKLYEPIKVGDPGDWYEGRPDSVCVDCGAKYGEQHLPNCDIERCPARGGQLITCNCGVVYDVSDNASDAEINKLIEKQRQESTLFHADKESGEVKYGRL